MSKVSASVNINKPIAEVFAYAASAANGPAFIPNLNENTNITPQEPGVGQTFDWRFNMGGVDLRGKAQVTEYDVPNRAKIVSTGDTNSTWTYSFHEENDATKVTLDVEYELAENAAQKLANKVVVEKLNQKSAEQSLGNLKTILEG